MDIKELKDEKYIDAYSEEKFFDKIIRFAKAAGIKVIYLALLLFYTLQQASTPMVAKSVIIGGLGYFILPLDIIPDFIPIVGFSDDFTALVSVLIAVALYIDDDIKRKAKAKLNDWFKTIDEKELEEIDRKINHNN